MANYPTLSSGTTVLTPFTRRERRPVRVIEFSDGHEQRFRIAGPLMGFTLSHSGISLADKDAIVTFFNSVKGAYDKTWSLVIGAETISNLCFESDELRVTESQCGQYDVTLTARQWRKN